MKISTITNWAYGVTVLLTALSGTAFILSDHTVQLERQALEAHLAMNDLSMELEIGAELRTDEARLYVMRGDQSHLEAFEAVNNREHELEDKARHAEELGATEEELSHLKSMASTIDALEEIELRALEHYAQGNSTTARMLLFGEDHYALHTKLINRVKQFTRIVNVRTTHDLEQAKLENELLGFIARMMLGLTAAVFLGVLYFVLKRRVSQPLTQMTGIVNRLADQDYEVEVPLDDRRDEIGELTAAIHIFRQNGLERERLDAERRRDLKIKDLFLQMMYRLQACQTLDELSDIVSSFTPQIFPHLAGGLYIANESRNTLQLAGSWQFDQSPPESFKPDDCWCLRRGRTHTNTIEDSDVTCSHLGEKTETALCIPLTAQNDTIGLLTFENLSDDIEEINEARIYLELIAENISLSVANLQLRERLTRQVARDGLTGLYNRRSLDEVLGDYAREAETETLTCLMIDIDHFKIFNDEFGHDAGDTVMQSFAGILNETVDGAGTCYRFGGEEFTVLLPKTSQGDAHALAEKIRTRTETSTFSHRGALLGPVTVSIGIATTPEGGTVSTLRTRADIALITAKGTGRNKTVLETDPDVTEKVVFNRSDDAKDLALT